MYNNTVTMTTVHVTIYTDITAVEHPQNTASDTDI